jgi:hypothetical protein
MKVAAPVKKTEINGRGDSLRRPRNTVYPLKLALTSPTSGGRSVGIVCWWTKAPEFYIKFHDSTLDGISVTPTAEILHDSHIDDIDDTMGHYREANSCLASQETCCLSWNTKVHYHVATGHCPESDESTAHPHTLIPYYPF